MHLELSVRASDLSVTVSNSSSQELRLWELENSWGWFSFAVEVQGESGVSGIIKRAPREWTRNAPTYFTLAAGERREIILNLKDGWWESDEGLSELKDDSLRVRVRYEVGPTPESESLGVFVGTDLSEWVESTPPHTWLFD
jgi:hypothetical protein